MTDGFQQVNCQVPEGWQPESWAQELRRRADCCQELKPEIARRFREWAEKIEEREKEPRFMGPFFDTAIERKHEVYEGPLVKE